MKQQNGKGDTKVKAGIRRAVGSPEPRDYDMKPSCNDPVENVRKKDRYQKTNDPPSVLPR